MSPALLLSTHLLSQTNTRNHLESTKTTTTTTTTTTTSSTCSSSFPIGTKEPPSSTIVENERVLLAWNEAPPPSSLLYHAYSTSAMMTSSPRFPFLVLKSHSDTDLIYFPPSSPTPPSLSTSQLPLSNVNSFNDKNIQLLRQTNHLNHDTDLFPKPYLAIPVNMGESTSIKAIPFNSSSSSSKSNTSFTLQHFLSNMDKEIQKAKRAWESLNLDPPFHDFSFPFDSNGEYMMEMKPLLRV
ncbi:hypothetical protein HMI56_005649, partial [Coelomomyces lativittatus]